MWVTCGYYRLSNHVFLTTIIKEELIVRNGSQPYGRSEENLKDLFVSFEILLSPSYRVPVLYFTVKTTSGLPVTDYDTMFSEVVPENFRSQVADVGVIGGVSMTVTAKCTLNKLYELRLMRSPGSSSHWTSVILRASVQHCRCIKTSRIQ